MSIRSYIAIVASLAAVVALIFMFVPVEATPARGGSFECGNVFDPDDLGAALRDAYRGGSGSAQLCDDAMSSRKAWTISLLAIGLVVAGGALLTSPRKRPSAVDEDTADSAPAS